MTQTPADAPHYRYDPHLGSLRDEYQRVDFRRTRTHQPEQPGRFVAVIEGESVVNSMWGRRVIKWRTEPGTPCLILGYWSDGTVHLKWAGLARNYMLDGRFPPWVVVEDPDAKMAGGGFVLLANELVLPGDVVVPWRLLQVLALLLVLVVLLLWPDGRDALGSLLNLGR
jgi:hypothetical protein